MCKKPLLVILAGPNGSGKSTLSESICASGLVDTCVYINPDILAKEKYGDWNNPEACIKAAEDCYKLRYQLLEEGKDIFFETVFSSPEKLEFLKHAKEKGYFIRMFFVSTNCPDINAARVSKRFRAGGHSVPIEKIVSRYEKSIKQAAEAVLYLDRAYFIDNSVDNANPKLVFQTRNGTLRKIYDEENVSWHKGILKAIKQNQHKVSNSID